jgi:hypothetical protein
VGALSADARVVEREAVREVVCECVGGCVGALSADARVVEREAVRLFDVLADAVDAERAVHEGSEAGERAQDEAEAAHLVVGDRVHACAHAVLYTRGDIREQSFAFDIKEAGNL